MSSQKIAVTGAAGFIGFHFSRNLLDNGYKVLGIDNLNDYYDPSLKMNRLEKLHSYQNFSFKKVNIINKKELEMAITSFQPEKVVHLAAQAGVRYSIKNPYAY